MTTTAARKTQRSELAGQSAKLPHDHTGPEPPDKDTMSRLGDSVTRVLQALAGDLSTAEAVQALLTETSARRALDLSDLSPAEQALLIAARTVEILPSANALADAIAAARMGGRGLTVKLGIDPTSADVHLGHAVPMIILSRFQRMGHNIVLIVGDMTAKIGDPSGRSAERPALSDEEIERNMATYRHQVAPFFDFGRAAFRHNSEWLAQVRLPELIGILAKVPVSMSLQREDFRARLAAGHGLAMSEFIYSVVMAIDSVKISADIELGGVDQLLNMQMGRKVTEITGQAPQLIAAMPLIEGTDGTGKKMSKSLGNYIAMTSPPEEIFGKIMSIPDRLIESYLQAWSEWTDAEIESVTRRVNDGTLHPMDLKRILAGEAVAAIYGVKAAMSARESFAAQFSRRAFGDVADLPVLNLAEHGGDQLGMLLTTVLAFAPSVSAARRMARQAGLRLITETAEGGQYPRLLEEQDVNRTLGDVAEAALATPTSASLYLKAGRKLARISTGSA